MSQVQNPNQSLVFVTARVSFPWLVEPQKTTNQDGSTSLSYNCDLIFPPTDAGYAKFMQEYARLAGEKWKENAQAAMQQIHLDRKKRCYAQGEEKTNSKTFQTLDGYAGMVCITTKTPRQPQIIDSQGKQIDVKNDLAIRAEASKIYGGCYVNAVIKPWLQENKHGIGVRCDLIAIQFREDGPAFGSAPVDTSGMFAAVAAPAAAPGFAPQAAPAPAMPGAPFPSFMGGN